MKIKGRRQSLRSKLFLYFFTIIAIMFFFIVFLINQTNTYNEMAQQTLVRAGKLQGVVEHVDEMLVVLRNFINSGEPSETMIYNAAYASAHKTCESLKNMDPSSFVYRDISEILTSLYEEGEKIIVRYTAGEGAFYLRGSLPSVELLQAYLREVVFVAINEDLALFDQYSKKITIRTRNYTQIIYLLCVMVTLLCVIFALRFSKAIADPIHSLSRSCLRVREGDFTTRNNRKSGTEIDILVKSFNDMVQAIEKSQYDVQQKAYIESKLKEEQIATEKMKSVLYETELKFLRMQINPHFLFNTFNTISALSQIEGAEITYEMIGRLSNILHYAMKGVGQRVTLEEEISITKDYLEIQKMRFQNRLNYEIKIPQNIMNINVDAMLLQPIVENSIIHGLEPRENGGTVVIHGCVNNKNLELVVEDDGIGFEKNKGELTEPSGKGHGIGLNNLTRRLNMLYGENSFQIKAKKNIGTKVILTLPIEN